MGIYSHYLDTLKSFQDINAERKNQLKRIAQLREGRNILVIASDLTKRAAISIDQSDLLAIADQLENLAGLKLDVILETPGGSGEVAEDIVKLFRSKFTELNFIIPGSAKSAGTIMTMAGDEILMEPASSLGPIDAQINWQGKVFSAEAFLKGLVQIKEEVEKKGLNKAYIPILQSISPGEIQYCENALGFAKELVTQWLEKYKFKDWAIHSSTKGVVTANERKARAAQIADNLCNHSKWLTHSRSIKMNDLQEMRLRITDYSQNAPLFDAIRRYYTLLRMTFESTGIYKLFETPTSQIYRFSVTPSAPSPHKGGDVANVDFECAKCHTILSLQANLDVVSPLEKGKIAFPQNNIIKCPQCGLENNLLAVRNQIEIQSKKKVVFEG